MQFGRKSEEVENYRMHRGANPFDFGDIELAKIGFIRESAEVNELCPLSISGCCLWFFP